jgi:hypothetical protein
VQVRELGTGKSRLEMLVSLGLRGRVVPALSVEDRGVAFLARSSAADESRRPMKLVGS